MKVIICHAHIYHFKGWYFEYKPYMGGWPLKKDLEPRKRAGMVFWRVLEEFCKLPESKRKELRVTPSCEEVTTK